MSLLYYQRMWNLWKGWFPFWKVENEVRKGTYPFESFGSLT